MRVAPLISADLISALYAAVPDFGPMIDEHVASYGELLPHVLFGDLTRFVLAGHERGDRDLERRSLSFLDRALREGDEEVRNLVQVSFVENVGTWEPAQQAFVAAWPDALRADAERLQ